MASGYDYQKHPLTFEASLAMRKLDEPGKHIFTPLHPPWTWPANPGVVPGGLLMSLCTKAAWTTLPSTTSQEGAEVEWTLSSINCTFLAGMDAKTHRTETKTGLWTPVKPIHYHVTVLSKGRRFQVRSVIAVQNGKNIVNATIGFVSTGGGILSKGKRMAHTSTARCDKSIVPDSITNDDLDPKTPFGPFMAFQRLPLLSPDAKGSFVTIGPNEARNPERCVAPTLAQIITPISRSTTRTTQHQMHILALLNLSDYHVLDTPLALQGVLYGWPAIGDTWANKSRRDVEMFTSLNHTVHIHIPELAGKAWFADEVVYIEVTSQWTRNGRASVESRIFATEVRNGKRVAGLLVATCVQEAYYVLKDTAATPHAASKI